MLMYPRLYLQVGSAKRDLTYLLRYCSPNICKWNYLLVFCPYKIQVNRFMGRDQLFGAILNFMTFLSFH